MSRARDLANSADNDITGTLTVDDITLSGNITVGGTVDGRDIATDGTKLDGIEANATADQTGAEIKAAYEGEADTNAFTDAEKTKLSGIEAGATADQTKADIDALNINADTLDGQHGSYYTSYADTAVANLVDTAPSTLDTLNELAAALGDDPNFSTTVTNNIATKLPLAGGTMTGAITFAAGQTFDGRDVSADGSKLDGIEAGATADQTASEILTAIKTVDGSGSGLDADTLDGLDSGSFLRSDTADSGTTITLNQLNTNAIAKQNNTAPIVINSGLAGSKALRVYYDMDIYNTVSFTDAAWGYQGSISGSGGNVSLSAVNGVNGVKINGNTVWHAGNDGSGSGLDADLLDGVQGSNYARTDVKEYFGQEVEFDGNVSSSGPGAVIGRNYTYDTLELRGYGAEMMIGSQSTNIEINYRACNNGAANNTPTLWRWRAGSSTSWSNHEFGSVSANGAITATGNVTAYYSDERLKTKTGDLEGALEKIKQLNGFYYVENDLAKELGYNNDQQQVALSAQEVQAVMPEAVSIAPFDMDRTEDGVPLNVSKSGEDYLTVDYARLVPLLVEAIKEQQAQIDELKAKLEG